ncbi:uncharacterized protein LOC144619283 [Crassostrea virginica]
MYNHRKLDDSDFELECLPFPKRTLFGDDKQLFDEDSDSGLGMEESADTDVIDECIRLPMIQSLFERPFARFSESPLIERRAPNKRNKRSTDTGEESQRKRPKIVLFETKRSKM